MTNTPIAQQVLQEELEAVRNNIYTDRYDMGIGELLSLYKDCELVIHSDENGYVDLSSEQKTRIIENLLIGLPAPAITVVTDGLGRWELIEGKQWLKAVSEKAPEKALSMNQRIDVKRAKVKVNIVGSKGNQPAREYYN